MCSFEIESHNWHYAINSVLHFGQNAGRLPSECSLPPLTRCFSTSLFSFFQVLCRVRFFTSPHWRCWILFKLIQLSFISISYFDLPSPLFDVISCGDWFSQVSLLCAWMECFRDPESRHGTFLTSSTPINGSVLIFLSLYVSLLWVIFYAFFMLTTLPRFQSSLPKKKERSAVALGFSHQRP